MTIGPFVASALGSISERDDGKGRSRSARVHLGLPGVRLALWFGGVITILSGLAARRRMRMAQRADVQTA